MTFYLALTQGIRSVRGGKSSKPLGFVAHMTPQIFVSYARSDQEQVFPIVEKLREKGLNIWIDQEGIHGAKLWSQEIVHAIEGCKVFILFASSTAFQSENVTKELALASEARKQILPVFLEDSPIPAAMKYQLAGIQHLIHQKGQEPQTIDNILRTLSNLEINSTEAPPPAPTISHAPMRTKPASKMPLAIAAVVALLAVLAFFFMKGDPQTGPEKPPATVKAYKSTTDLCIVTVSNSGKGQEVSEGNRELREELDAKLARFKDYKVEKGKAVSPDATTQELLTVARELDTEFILQSTINSEKNRITVKLLNVEDGRNFWSKTIRESDVESDIDFINEASGLIAAHIAGHDGAIHRNILAKALVKKEEDLIPMELLQLGKATWEGQTEDVTLAGTRYLEKCIELNPDISTAHAILSEVYLEDVRRDYNKIEDAMSKAKTSVARAIELNPSNAIALIEQIWISWYEKDFTSCNLQIEEALKANPYEPLVLVSAGSFLAGTGEDLEAGKKYLDQALKYNETPQGWYYWAYINYYMTKGDNKKALEYAIKSNDQSLGMGNIAALHWINGEKDTALKFYNEILLARPDFSMESYTREHEIWARPLEIRDQLVSALNEVISASVGETQIGPKHAEPKKVSKIEYKSTTDLCLVTMYEDQSSKEVSLGNRELRDELDSKLTRFKDYRVERGEAVSPDITTQELLAAAKKLKTEFILQASINSDKNRITAKLLNVKDGRNFWSKIIRASDIEGEGDFIDKATGLIAAHIAGHDGAIHRDILAKALVKKEEDLTPIELLQLGKNVWEEQTEDVTVKGTRFLEKCIELNPDISTAHAILSEVYLEDIRANYNLIPEAMKKAKESVSRSIELNPSNAIALIEQIWISWYEKDFTACKLQAEAAIKANPYEPLVLVSVGSFYLSTGMDLKLGKEYNDLSLKYNETPQGWYYVGYINYYITNNNYEKALEYALKSGTHNNEAHMARASALYWVNDQKDTAIKYYKELIRKYPEYNLDTLRRHQDVWSRAKESKELIQNAFKEVAEASKN